MQPELWHPMSRIFFFSVRRAGFCLGSRGATLQIKGWRMQKISGGSSADMQRVSKKINTHTSSHIFLSCCVDGSFLASFSNFNSLCCTKSTVSWLEREFQMPSQANRMNESRLASSWSVFTSGTGEIIWSCSGRVLLVLYVWLPMALKIKIMQLCWFYFI